MFPSVDKGCSPHRECVSVHTLQVCGLLGSDNSGEPHRLSTRHPLAAHSDARHYATLNIRKSSLT